ncbi:MAG: hypothetical protein M3O87_03380 [Candidatus Dormibacteraeota bacterium]|nr:hypothetical protein [Candidatus Dormibacteraeota bacterium]
MKTRLTLSRAVTLVATGVAIAACSDGTAVGGASPSPYPSPSGIFGPLGQALAPPPQPSAVPAPATPTPLSSAAAKTTAAGSFRIKIAANFTDVGAGKTVAIAGDGEEESPARTHLSLKVTLPVGSYSAETATYDGSAWTKANNEPWVPAAADASNTDPQGLLNYSNAASGITDLGVGERNGIAVQKYGATLNLPDRSPAPGKPPTITRMVGYVDNATGRLIAEDVIPVGGGIGVGQLQIDFFDFGATIRVEPPIAGRATP